MAKIPTRDEPQLKERPVSQQYGNVNFDAGGAQLGRAIGQLGDAVDQAAERASKAKLQADSIALTDAETALESRWQERMQGSSEGPEATPGFLSSKGTAAAEQSQQLYEDIEADRQEVAEGLTETQRKHFLRRSERMKLSVSRQVEGHVSQQRSAASEASLRARTEKALNTVANSYADEDVVAEQLEALKAPIRGLSLSKEDAEAKEARLEQEVAKVRLRAFISAGDWKGAETLFNREKEVLGTDAVQFEKDIGSVKREASAEEAAIAVVKEATDKNGKVNAADALSFVDSITDTKLREETRRRAKERIIESDRAYDAKSAEISKDALAAYNTRGWSGIPGPLKDELNERNGPLYRSLQNEAELKWRRHNDNSAEARREQRERDRIALNDFDAMDPEDRANTDLAEYLAGRGVSDVGASELRKHHGKAKETVSKGESESESEFTREAKAAAQGVVKGKADEKEFAAEAQRAYQKLKDANKGQAPSRKDLEEELSALLRKGMTKPGLLYGTNEEVEYKRRARERKEAAEKSGEATEAPSKSKKTRVARIRELKDSGVSRAEAEKTLKAEGY